MIRLLLIKYFFGDYIFNIFGKRVNYPRAVNINAPLISILGMLSIITDTYPVDTLLGCILLALLGISLFVSVIYTKLKPLELNDIDYLDISQKFQVNEYFNIPKEKSKEIKLACKKLLSLLNENRFYNIQPFLKTTTYLLFSIIIILIFYK